MLALIGLALGASNRKDGKLASFALGFGVIFVYYIMLYSARARRARRTAAGRASRRGSPTSSSARSASRCVIWRAGSADQPIRFSIPRFWRAREDAAGGDRAARPVDAAAGAS